MSDATPAADHTPSPPSFVVVGHVNRGKSTVVSTLAADDRVAVSDIPGTTRRNHTFPMEVDGRVLYRLIDTPGFERARHVLAWLREHETSTSDRPDNVRRFLEVHREDDRFAQERELLRPILDGGAILYVVDGSVPFSPASEAEMEILRWTGQPRMALINPIGETDHTAQWRPVLDQYFSMVRVFDAHEADFPRRLELLRTLREIDERYRPAIDAAIKSLLSDRRSRLAESAGAIADALVEMLTAVEEKRLPPETDPAPHQPPLRQRYEQRLREREQKLRRELKDIYDHHVLDIAMNELGPVGEDLFDRDTWNRLGLTQGQLVAAGAATGAVIGGGIDAALSAATFMTGALIGGAVGAASSWFAWGRLNKVKVLGQTLGGTLLRIGPNINPQFPWVVLDRALLFHHVVAHHAHGRRAAVDLRSHESIDKQGVVSGLPRDQRRVLEKLFQRCRKRSESVDHGSIRRELTDAIFPILRQRDGDSAGS